MEEPPQRAIAERQPASGQLSAQLLEAHVPARLEDLQDRRRMGFDHVRPAVAAQGSGARLALRARQPAPTADARRAHLEPLGSLITPTEALNYFESCGYDPD